MYCTKCGNEQRDGDRYCPGCGAQAAGTPRPDVTRSLLLDKRNKKVAGVCAGFARYLDVDVVLVRVFWLGLSLCTGVGFLVYLAAWIVIPGDAGVDVRRTAGQHEAIV